MCYMRHVFGWSNSSMPWICLICVHLYALMYTYVTRTNMIGPSALLISSLYRLSPPGAGGLEITVHVSGDELCSFFSFAMSWASLLLGKSCGLIQHVLHPFGMEFHL